MKTLSHLNIAHTFWQKIIAPGDTVVDATAGNGHDCLFLAPLARHLIAFDIQAKAIENTKMRLKAHSNVTYHHICHSKMADVVQHAKLITFNLGYLPGADKSLTTNTESTIEAIKAALSIIEPQGLISITCYPGHPEGLLERDAILAFCQQLDPKKWIVTSYSYLNKTNRPHLILINCIGCI